MIGATPSAGSDTAILHLRDRPAQLCGPSSNGAVQKLNTTVAWAPVIGTDHSKAPWHGWTCAAAPVIHPVLGRVAGAVNITCRAEDANHLLLVLRSLVNAVRGALDEAASTRERRLMDAHMASALSPRLRSSPSMTGR